jgi:hypothetical protein
VIQSGIFGAIQARQYFGAEDRKRDEGYMFFPLLNGEAMAQVVPGMQQIVFTSHNPPQIDARHIALEIKEKNPMALVFAFTIRSIEGGNCGQLDGIINKASNLVSQRLDFLEDDNNVNRIFQNYYELKSKLEFG